jgi:hypothetical protein
MASTTTSTSTSTPPAVVEVRGTATVQRRRRWWRRLLPFVAAVVVVLLAAEVAVRAVEDRLPPPSGWISDEYPRKVARIDDLAAHGGAGVVLLGSSVMDVAVDPAGLSVPRGAYNAGLIGATPRIVDAWGRNLVVPKLRPDTVVVAISSRDLNGNGVGMASTDELFEGSAGGRWLLGTQSLADRAEWWLDRHSALLRQRQNLRRPLEALGHYDPPDRNFTQLTDGGLETHLLDTTYRDDEAARAFFRREPMRDFAVTDDQLGALRRLVGSLRGDGIRVVVLDVPVTADYVSLHPHGAADYDAYERAIDAVGADFDADVLRPGVWPTELFSDALHLNGDGVRRLTAELDRHLTG